MQDFHQIYEAAKKEKQELEQKQAVLKDRIKSACEQLGFDPNAENLSELIVSKKNELEEAKKQCEEQINKTIETLKALGINV